MPVPQALEDLPYAKYLEEFEGALTRDAAYVEQLFADRELEDTDAGNCRVTESAICRVNFTNGRLLRARFHDVWINRTQWVGTSLAEVDWLDVVVLGSSFAGVEAHGSSLRRVTFQECRIDTLNLRGAKIQDVVFDRCELSDVDLDEAIVSNLTFPESRVRRLRIGKATLKKVDFRGAAELDVASGYDSMRGAVIDSGQLVELAPGLAHSLGIVVKDH